MGERCKLSTNLSAQLVGMELIFQKAPFALGKNTKSQLAKEILAVLLFAKAPMSDGICAVSSVLEEENVQCGIRCRLFLPTFKSSKAGSRRASATTPSADEPVYFLIVQI